jgi:hypothetical protein
MGNVYFFIGLLTILMLTGCSDNSTGSDGIENSEKSLAIRLVNTGSEDFEIETGAEGTINFCFEGEGCDDSSGGFGFASVHPDQEMFFGESNPDKVAIGVRVGMKITAGKGKIEIVRGLSYHDGAGFLEFTPSKVVHTSSTFVVGDVVGFDWGETD